MSTLASGLENFLLDATGSGAGSAEKGRSTPSQEVGSRCVAGGSAGGGATWSGAMRGEVSTRTESDT